MKNSYLTATDQFCGAGGSSIGATKAGVEVKLAMNHWPLAISTHNTNFPDTVHVCTDISATDPRRYPSTDILITSPECFPAGTIVIAKRGLIPIELIKVSDQVLTHNNLWHRVSKVTISKKETVIVRGQGHRGIEVSGSHPFYVRRQSKQWNNEIRRYVRTFGDVEWIKAKNLTVELTRWASPIEIPSLMIPPVNGENNRYIEFSSEFWWMIGRWLGDGLVRIREDGSNEITICCGKSEIEELSALNFAPRSGPHAKQGELHWRNREIRTAHLFECTHNSLAQWIVDNFGKGAHGKTLPSWALGMSTEWREALLEGYVSSDGSRTERYTMTGSVSKSLSLGIRLLATGLGYYPTFGCYRYDEGSIEGRKFKAYDMWIVRWENNKSQRTGISDGQHSWTLVKDVQETGCVKTVYNLSVEVDESYVADGIVVHNCTNHTIAKGKKRQYYSQDLFGKVLIDPAEERSRATMWDVPRFAEFHDYNLIIVENVVDAGKWRLWDSWIHAMHSLDYEHGITYFNSMFAWPTPQSRDRMYTIFWKKGNPAPDLGFYPLAPCPVCEKDVNGIQSWKKSNYAWGRYKAQYFYRCPVCHNKVEPYYYAAFNAIDWSLKAERIGDRKVPLKPKTIERIKYGLDTYGRTPLVVTGRYTTGVECRVHDAMNDVIPTQPGDASHAVAFPWMVETAFTHSSGNRSISSASACTTQTTRQTLGLCGFLSKQYGGGARPQDMGIGMNGPIGTVTTYDHHAVIGVPVSQEQIPPSFVAELHGTSHAHGIVDALACFSGSGAHHALIETKSFLSYYYGTLAAGKTTDPMHTMTGVERAALIGSIENMTIDDLTFRMLAPHEIGKAMAFPAEYQVLGVNKEKVKQYGNAVTPPVMEMLVKRCIQTLE